MTSLIRRTALLRYPGPHGYRGGGTLLLRRTAVAPLPDTTGVLAYLDARRTTTLFADSAFTTPVSAGGSVGGWQDTSGNDNHATQATAPPSFAASGINGRPGVLFTRADSEYLDSNGLAAALSGADVALSVVAVIKKTTTAQAHEILAGSNSGATPPLVVARTSAGNALQYFVRDDTNASASPAGGTVGTDPCVVSFVTSGTVVSIWKNGTAVVTAQAANVGQITIDQVGIGAVQDRSGSGLANVYDGLIGALVVCAGALSTGERSALEQYFGAGFGITVV